MRGRQYFNEFDRGKTPKLGQFVSLTEYKADFDAIYPELSEAYGTLYAENFFAGISVNESRLYQQVISILREGPAPTASLR